MSTRRVTVTLDGFGFSDFSSISISRDLTQIAGGFEAPVMDQRRIVAALYDLGHRPFQTGGPIMPSPVVGISLDGTLVFKGHLERVKGIEESGGIGCTLTGRDMTGDLVECSPLPTGPAEFRQIGLLDFVKQVCAPFGIPVRADVDLGDPFERIALHPHDKAMAAIDKAARQRSTLVVSDGVGGLLLTRGGSTRAPGAIRMGENAMRAEFDIDWTKRFSHYYVKGQTDQVRQRKGSKAALDSSVVPLSADGSGPAAPRAPAAAGATARNKQAVLMTGLAIDPEITRYRPLVVLTRTQSGMASVQEQAEWHLRTAKGRSTASSYTVLDWQVGGTLWLPNQVAAVSDPYAGVDGDQLIAGVTWRYDETAETTTMRLVDPTAYDRTNEADKKRPRSAKRGKKAQGKLDSSVVTMGGP